MIKTERQTSFIYGREKPMNNLYSYHYHFIAHIWLKSGNSISINQSLEGSWPLSYAANGPAPPPTATIEIKILDILLFIFALSSTGTSN